MKRHHVLPVLMLLLATTGLFAGGQSEPEGVGPTVIEVEKFIQPRRMIFYFEADPEFFSSTDVLYLYHSVMIAVADANKDVVILESESPGVPRSAQDKEQGARDIQADCWLLVSAGFEEEQVVFDVETFDILTQEVHGAERISLGGYLDYRSLSRGAWDPIVDTIGSSYAALLDELPVTILGLPGATVRGQGVPEFQIGSDGTAEIPLANPALYAMEATNPGYYPRTELFYLGYKTEEVDLRQFSIETMAVDLKISNSQFFGANYYYFLEPGEWYLKGGFTTYAFGLYLLENSQEIWDGNPLTLLRLGGGKYWGDQAEDVRFFTGANLLGQFAHDIINTDDPTFGFDDNAPVALELSLGAEYVFPGVQFKKRFRVFAELDPVIYYTFDPEVFYARNFKQSYVDDLFGYYSVGPVVFSYLKLSLGAKYSW